jgi:hypothetical protein
MISRWSQFPGPTGVCSYRALPVSCETPSDCCPELPAGYTCNQDYPYVYACAGGECRTAGCTADEQCATWYDDYYSASGYVSLGCQ